MNEQHSQDRLHIGAGDASGTSIFTGHHANPIKAPNKEYARRLVACWNACDGTPTDLIEQGGFAAVPVATHREVKTQRDELLVALEDLVKHGNRAPWSKWERALEVIAKVKGGAA